MKLTAPCSLLAFINLIAWCLTSSCTAFVPSRTSSSHHHAILHHHHHRHHNNAASTRLQQSTDPDEPENGQEETNRRVANDLGLDIIRVNDSSEISDEIWDGIEGGAPTRWMVMKNLLGINIFTYILAAFIIFFLSMNFASGPGWLGQSLGWEDVGTFTRVSDSLPLDVDVSGSQYLLQ
eukprot:CAMPEP_0201878774 /NCGR_PEP_ID=MMETSP0902-20130614/9848_1 /ASSEMBLY_ACC=CAM_ASM_000551 /TAXON_ID=420261 /ORGANISM="Thalassiosira antarctica, Strain CCMP982" /LENGTH=178 /DNA_ID=CAMNT_0048406467 /DNA_START=90 /DNA_END=626 /DNA_ORIENTATION=-